MKRRISGALLTLLLLVNLTACGQVQGADAGLLEQLGSQADSLAEVLQGADGPAEAASSGADRSADEASEPADAGLAEDGWYNSKEDVALYLHLYGRLPDNYVTKAEAEQAGWTGGSVERYTGEGTAIGGSYFGNYEGQLPKEAGRSYCECDIDTVGKNSRGASRLVYSNDGLVYCTEDHYESFELLYGAP